MVNRRTRHAGPTLHRLLRHQRHLVETKAKAVVSGLKSVNAQGQSPNLSTELSRVAVALRAMHSHAIKHPGGDGTEFAAKGIKQLEDAYDSLARAQLVAEPAARFALIAHAVDQLNRAKKSAHRAGGDWPL